MLHITNGDAALAVLRHAVHGDIVPWRDVLHEGPVHADLPFPELSRIRSSFIASAGWGGLEEIERQSAARDAALAACHAHDEVVLWFEHDLYDQLQFIQVLDWFRAHPHPRLALVCEAEYLGIMAPERAATLFRSRRNVTPEMLAEAGAAWRAFGSPHPGAISLEFRSGLPFLAPALRRHLEEFPWTTDGLSRLERQALHALHGGPLDVRTLYRRAHHEQEEPVWLGDTVFAWHLARLAKDGFVEEAGGAWRLTKKAIAVLDGKADAWGAPRQPRWLGGFLLSNGMPRWDARSAALVGS